MWELDHKEGWMPKNWCFWTVVLEKTLWDSFGQQGDQTSQSSRKLALNTRWKDWCWSWSSNSPTTWCKELTLEKILMPGKIEGRRRGWQRMRWLDGITDSMTWVWVNSGSWWWTGKPGVLLSMGSQRVGHNWATELNWTLGWINNPSIPPRYCLIDCNVN